jgi:hypothetical protein
VIGPKVAIWRSRPYRMWVASQPCFGCGIEGYSQCAHENAGKGRGLKSGDDRTFPLCSARPGKIGCHQEHDLCIDQTRAMRDADARVWVARMQYDARKAGWKLPMPAASENDDEARCDEKELT